MTNDRKKHLIRRLRLTPDERRHLLVSFLLALSIRGDITENVWAVVPLVVIMALHETNAAHRSDATGLSLSDLCCEQTGAITGYILAVMI